MSNDLLNSLKFNKKRDLTEISSEDVKSDKSIKGNKLNVMNDDCKDIIKSTQSLDDIPKQVNVPITKLVDSYLSFILIKELRCLDSF